MIDYQIKEAGGRFVVSRAGHGQRAFASFNERGHAATFVMGLIEEKRPSNLYPERIISSGQTGAASGALRACLELGHPCGGFCTRNRSTEDGRIPDEFPLVELDTNQYQISTQTNIEMSDATLLIFGERGPRSPITEDICDALCIPLMLLPFRTYHTKSISDWAEDLAQWCRIGKVKVLNVGGLMESKVPGIEQWTSQLIRGLIVLGRKQ